MVSNVGAGLIDRLCQNLLFLDDQRRLLKIFPAFLIITRSLCRVLRATLLFYDQRKKEMMKDVYSVYQILVFNLQNLTFFKDFGSKSCSGFSRAD